MPTSTRPHDLNGGPPTKRGHAPQISISDDNHHVTEAIGDMYGDNNDYGKGEQRPLSFGPSPQHEAAIAMANEPSSPRSPALRSPLARGMSFEGESAAMAATGKISPHSRSNSFGRDNGPLSPTLSIRETSAQDTANAHFPLNDVDYESSPAAVAQELVNLQALRRMSMVDNAAGDPDLPEFTSPLMPTAAPTGADDEEDTSRLFWVPARIHPELAPREFKSFLETRVDQIKRRSGDESLLSANSVQREGGGGGLKRKKSMLSRQIDNVGGRAAEGYRDGAERLERKRSAGQHRPDLKVSDLQELDEIAQDPSELMRKLSIDTSQRLTDNGEVPAREDMPILPAAPSNSLRRSTRTTYRRGSLRKGERVPPSKRAARVSEADGDEILSPSPISPPVGRSLEDPAEHASPADSQKSDLSRLSRSQRGRAFPPGSTPTASFDDILGGPSDSNELSRVQSTPTVSADPASDPWTPLDRRSTAPVQLEEPVVPRIVETPPPPEDDDSASVTSTGNLGRVPERKSSHDSPSAIPPASSLPPAHPSGQMKAGRSMNRPGLVRQAQNARNSNQTLNDIVGQPSPLPGNSTRTDSLSFIPTFTDEKSQNKKKKDRDGHDGGRKSSWGWLLGNEEKDKDKEKEKEKEKDTGRRAKGKGGKAADKSHDNTRLDLLQTSIDGGRGRESLVLDRDNLRLEEERKKESSRKSSGEAKKEKDGIFSSLFGGGKKKGDREGGSSGKKERSLRGLSPEPPYRPLRPDVDYNWTRFSLLEERAIYRMAHIKLANPRRPLYSQVLLSNFMYSYLAKVQQMHPQMNIPQAGTPKGQRQQPPSQQQQQQQQQQHGYQDPSQHQHQPQDQHYQYRDQQSSSDQPYANDQTMYNNYEAGDSSMHGHDSSHRPQSRGSQQHQSVDPSSNGYHNQYHRQPPQGASNNQNPNLAYASQFDDPDGGDDDDDDDDMW